MSAWGRAARLNRQLFTSRAAELATEMARLQDRDLNDRARLRVEGMVRADLKAVRDELVAKTTTLVDAAAAELAKHAPGARRREAIFRRPERYAAMLAALSNVPDEELPAYAALARSERDDAAFAALTMAAAGRKMEPKTRQALDAALVPMEDAAFTAALTELVVSRAELAAIHLEYAASPAGTNEGFSDALTLHRAATAVEVDGHARTLSEEELDAAYQRLTLDRVTVVHPDQVA
jgi:hypothetical protein